MWGMQVRGLHPPEDDVAAHSSSHLQHEVPGTNTLYCHKEACLWNMVARHGLCSCMMANCWSKAYRYAAPDTFINFLVLLLKTISTLTMYVCGVCMRAGCNFLRMMMLHTLHLTCKHKVSGKNTLYCHKETCLWNMVAHHGLHLGSCARAWWQIV